MLEMFYGKVKCNGDRDLFDVFMEERKIPISIIIITNLTEQNIQSSFHPVLEMPCGFQISLQIKITLTTHCSS